MKQARRRKAERQERCWNWLLQDGNVHYACNGSSFATYTKLDAAQSVRILGQDGAIGIGAVNLVVPRAHRAPDVCSITLFDVLHIPAMPCNGISIPRLRRAGAGVLKGPDRTVVLHGAEVAQLFEARPVGLGPLHRVRLFGELEESAKIALVDEPPLPLEMIGGDGEAERVSRLARELKDEEWQFKALSGESHGVACRGRHVRFSPVGKRFCFARRRPCQLLLLAAALGCCR